MQQLQRKSTVLARIAQYAFVRRGLATSSPAAGLIEVREYTLKPDGVKQWLQITADYAGARKELLPFLGMFQCDIGSCLHRVTHWYHWKDFDEREEVRSKAGRDPRWQKYIDLARPHVQYQDNKIMLEAKALYDAVGIPSTAQFKARTENSIPGKKVMYEMRSYQLHPGYGSVPKLVEAFKAGLPDKVAADPDGQLVFFGNSDVGMLNNVVELWRYPSAQACIRARQAARTVPKWRDTISAVTPGVQHFTSAFMYPVNISPWQ